MRRIFFILFCILLVSSGNAIQYEYYNRNAQYNAAHKYGGQVGVLTPGTSQGFGVLSALTNLEEVDSGLASGQKAINVATLNLKAPTESAVTSYVTRITDALQASVDGKQDVISDLATIRSGAEAGATAVQPNDLATVATTGKYNDLSGRPVIGYGTIILNQNNNEVGRFHVNEINQKSINFTVPTKTSELTNDSGFLTQHQDISGKANLSDLGTAAAADTTDFATATQGAKADTALQSGDNVSELTNDAGYLTAHQSLTDLGITATSTELNYTDGVTGAIQTQLDGKQATISDLATIRSGASAGATAVQPGDLATVATTGAYSDLSGAPTIGSATLTIQKNGTAVDSFSANATSNKTINITVPTTASDVSALPSSTKYGSSLSMSIDNTTYVITTALKDQDGNTLGTAQTIDLPLETMVVGASYNATTKKIILTLKNGNTVDFSVADLVSGLQTEIKSSAKLSADLVDDTSTTNKFVTATDKTAWNNKVDKVATANKVYGTDANGAQTTYDKNSFGQVDDVKVGTTSVVSNKIASLGTAAGAATTDFATAAQGTKADTAVQPGANVSVLTNDAGYLTAHQSLSDLGLTATATELNYVDGVTSNIQTQLNEKQPTLTIDTSLSSSSVNTAVPGALATYNFSSNAANLTTGNLPYARVSNIVGTGANTIAAGNDSRFNSIPTSQPSGSAGTGRAFMWIQ